jgi:hypothetical protein
VQPQRQRGLLCNPLSIGRPPGLAGFVRFAATAAAAPSAAASAPALPAASASVTSRQHENLRLATSGKVAPVEWAPFLVAAELRAWAAERAAWEQMEHYEAAQL